MYRAWRLVLRLVFLFRWRDSAPYRPQIYLYTTAVIQLYAFSIITEKNPETLPRKTGEKSVFISVDRATHPDGFGFQDFIM